MVEQTAEQIANRLAELGLIEDRQLQSAWGEFGRADGTADEFLQFLVRRELLTKYQVTRLLNGDRGGYFYGDYKVLYLVSAGSFARVYRAVDRRNGRVVALKLLRRRFSDDPAQTEQFAREGEMGRSLRHPNIVPIFEVCSKGPNHFLVMEFVEGHNLREFLKIRKKIDPVEATRLMIDVTSGLNYAHQRGVLHRDLKLTNILVSSRGQARLVDFGLAGGDVDENDEDAEASNPRTIDYAGLERATGVRKDDPRSDVYFLGCIYYHILTGKPPLNETRDRIQRLNRQRYVDVVPIHRVAPDLPRVVALMVNKAMELNPERRYQTPGQLLVDLNIALKRLEAGTDAQETAADLDASDHQELVVAATDEERNRLSALLIPEHQRRVLMFVESNVKMQDIFRDGMKRCGYRVLLTSDPQRAIGRFRDNAKAADCVIFSTGDLGRAAVEAFNEFGTQEETRAIPAVLLLGEKHLAWKADAQTDSRRRVIVMPLKLKELRTTIMQLVPPVPQGAAIPETK